MLFSPEGNEVSIHKLKVSDLMTANVLGIEGETPLSELPKLFFEYAIRHFPVVDASGKLTGILSHRDYLAAMPSHLDGVNSKDIEQKISGYKVSDIARKEVKTITADDTLIDAASIMRQFRVGSLVVVDGDRVDGIICESDFMKLALGRSV